LNTTTLEKCMRKSFSFKHDLLQTAVQLDYSIRLPPRAFQDPDLVPDLALQDPDGWCHSPLDAREDGGRRRS
jgi:hypothetical protein